MLFSGQSAQLTKPGSGVRFFRGAGAVPPSEVDSWLAIPIMYPGCCTPAQERRMTPTAQNRLRIALESETQIEPAYLIMDAESVPDGRLIAHVKYPGESLSPEEAVARAQREARERSFQGSDFLPPMFQYP